MSSSVGLKHNHAFDIATGYAEQMNIVDNMMDDLSGDLLNYATTVSGDYARAKRPVKGLKEGEPYLAIGIKGQDQSELKAYLVARGILKHDNGDYCDLEYKGNKCPMVVFNNHTFKRLPKTLEPKVSATVILRIAGLALGLFTLVAAVGYLMSGSMRQR